MLHNEQVKVRGWKPFFSLMLVVALAIPAVSGASPDARARWVNGGCGITPLYRGASPAWTANADPPSFLPHVFTAKHQAVGYLFGYPLRAGHPTDPTNKILWVVRQPRDGSDLVLSAHPVRRPAPVVRVSEPDDSSPGEIYPSIVDVPKAGCWAFTLRWHGNTDTLDLLYH